MIFDRKDWHPEVAPKIISKLLNDAFGVCSFVNARHDVVLRCNTSDQTYKISGSAFKVCSSRVFSHGTLLFRTDLEILRRALKPTFDNAEFCVVQNSPAVSSIRSSTANMFDFIQNGFVLKDKDSFLDSLMQAMISMWAISHSNVQDASDLQLNATVKEDALKLSAADWVFGKSPAFEIRRINQGTLTTAETANDSANLLNLLHWEQFS